MRGLLLLLPMILKLKLMLKLLLIADELNPAGATPLSPALQRWVRGEI